MAIPLSEEKRITLLDAAITIIVSKGLGASTIAIAKYSNVAQGTLFRYFAIKDELFNELYLYIKKNLGEAIQQKLSSSGDLYNTVMALWNSYIDWGISNPAAIKTLQQLAVSDKITKGLSE